VCLSVGLSVHEDISRTTRAIFTNLCVCVAYGSGSALRHRCDTLCTSGFMDDIILFL